jgi:transcriptional regulator with XRE-family HTH domain
MPDPTPDEQTPAAQLASRLVELRGNRRQVDVAAESGISQPQIARFERGKQVPRPDQVEALCRVYKASKREVRQLAGIAQDIREGTKRVVMTKDYAGYQRMIGKLEKDAKLIRGFSPSGVLGLLQSHGYLRELFTTDGEITPEDEAGAKQRLANQETFADASAGRRFVLIMPEGSFGFPTLGSAEVMAKQVEHIAEVSHQPHIRVGIIPWGRVCPVMVTHSWEMYDNKAVVSGTAIGTNFIESPKDVAVFKALFVELERISAWDDEARAILARVADQYRSRT